MNRVFRDNPGGLVADFLGGRTLRLLTSAATQGFCKRLPRLDLGEGREPERGGLVRTKF